jgi:hypothetical protein
MPNEALFHRNPKLLGRQFGQIHFGTFGVFSTDLSALGHFGTVSPLFMFSINQPLFLQKPKPLYPNPNFFFGIGIGIWVVKN